MMKKIITFFFMLSCILEISAQYQVTVIGATNDVVNLRCVGYGKKASKAYNDAELSAIRTILFVGAKGTQHSMPLINEDKSIVENKFHSFFSTFYNEGYKSFLESSIIVVPFGKNSLKQRCITLDVCIRISQLREYLENNGIIRRFGL